MKKFITYLYNHKIKVLSLFFISLFLSTSLFFLFTTKRGIPPDENYHLEIIDLYSEPFTLFLKNQEGTAWLGPINRTPFLYHFILGKILIINDSLNIVDDYIFLRLLNWLIGGLFLVSTLKFLKDIGANGFIRVFVLLMLSQTTMLQLLFGANSYDNLTNLLSILSFVFLINFYKDLKFSHFINWLIVSFLGLLVKFSYAPLFLFQLIFIFVKIFKEKSKIFNKEYLIKVKKTISLFNFLSILILISINFYYYGLNLLKYSSLNPKCNDVLTHEQCMDNGPYSRNYNAKVKNNSDNNLTEFSLISLKEYYLFTYDRLIIRQFDLVTHEWLHAHKNVYVFLPFLINLGLFLVISKNKNEKYKYILWIIFFYHTTLFFKLYSAYLSTGIYGVAVQGRYLFPIIVPLYYFVGKGFNKVINNGFGKIIFLTFLLIMLNQLVFRELIHKMTFGDTSYLEKSDLVYKINHYIQKIPRIVIFEK